MRTNFVGSSLVSAITQTPASASCGPVTVPAISLGAARPLFVPAAKCRISWGVTPAPAPAPIARIAVTASRSCVCILSSVNYGPNLGSRLQLLAIEARGSVANTLPLHRFGAHPADPASRRLLEDPDLSEACAGEHFAMLFRIEHGHRRQSGEAVCVLGVLATIVELCNDYRATTGPKHAEDFAHPGTQVLPPEMRLYRAHEIEC